MTIRLVRSTGIAVALSVGLIATSAPAWATDAPPTADAVYTGAPNQLTLPITPEKLRHQSSITSGSNAPALNPVAIAACNAGLGDVSVTSYQTPTEGKLDLFCGDSKSGYVHIRSNHQGDWQAQIDSLGGGANWDDWMEYQLSGAVTAPEPGFPIGIGGNKSCYTTPIQIFTEEGDLYRTFYPTIITSQNNHLVITAIPTTSETATNCYRAT